MCLNVNKKLLFCMIVSEVKIDKFIWYSAGCEDAEVAEEEGDQGGRGVV